MAKIPEKLWDFINKAYPNNVCLVCTNQPDGYAQASPRGSIVILDGDTMGYWNRGGGTTHENVEDGTKVTVFFHDPETRKDGLLPMGGIARFYGTAVVHKDGDMREKIWTDMVQPERDRDPDKKGYAVVINVERAEALNHKPLE